MGLEQTVLLTLMAKDEASGVLGKIGGKLGGLASGPMMLAGAGIAAVGAGVVLAAKAVFDFSQDTTKAMKLFQAQTGLSKKETGLFKEQAKDLWKKGFGENITEVVENMSTVRLALQGTAEETAGWTKDAMTLANVFQVDVAESMAWVGSMSESMGIDASDAFDIITKGMQMGLDVGGDFGDTLNEYSSDFARLGIKGPKVLALLNAGLEAGAHNTDVIADGWREYGIRLNEGGEDMVDVFNDMGLSYEDMAQTVADGEAGWGDYSDTVLAGLSGIDDELERNRLGVEIFGTKWEDVGGDVFLAAQGVGEGVAGITGATDAAGEAMRTGLGPAVERMKRTVIEGFAPLGDKVGEALNKMAPHIEKAIDWLGVQIPIAMTEIGKFWKSTLEPAFKQIVAFIQDPLMPIIEKFATWYLAMLPKAFEKIKKFWNSPLKGIFAAIVAFIQDPLIPIIEKVVLWLGENIPKAFEAIESFWNDPLSGVFAAIVGFIEDPLIPIIEDVVEWLGENIPKAFKEVKKFWNDPLKVIFQAIVDFVEDPLIPAVEKIVTFFTTTLPDAWKKVQGYWDNLKEIFQSLIDFVEDDLLDAFNSIKDGLTGAFTGAVGVIKTALNGIISALESAVNWAIQGLNRLIGAANKLPGVSIDLIPSIELPRLAQGGMTLAPEMLALLHGNEAVLPLDNPRTITALANAMREALGDQQGDINMNYPILQIQADSPGDLFEQLQDIS